MSSKRIGHRKSRNGCVRCKARRVKCDERRPCTNCIRYDVPCSLESSGIPTPISLSSPAAISSDASFEMNTQVAASAATPACSPSGQSDRLPVAATQLPVTGVPQQTTHSSPLLNGQGSQESTSYYSPEWILSLRLFHHWCTSVHLTYSQDPATREIWKNVVPDLACNNELLLHSILAISALHYGHTHPEERREYQINSAIYQNMALRGFSERLGDINESNCEALFLVASCIFKLTMHNISNPQQGDKPLAPSDVARFFIMLQGIRRILDFKPIERWAKEGPLAPLMLPYEMPPMTGTTSFSRRMDLLTILAREQTVSFEVINPQSACLLAIESLRSTHALAVRDKSVCGSHGLWIWIMSLPSLFINMLNDSEPVPLVILAHYAAILRPYEQDDWVFKGWSSSVLGVIERALAGQDRLLGYIAWPKRSLEEGIDVDDMGDEEA